MSYPRTRSCSTSQQSTSSLDQRPRAISTKTTSPISSVEVSSNNSKKDRFILNLLLDFVVKSMAAGNPTVAMRTLQRMKAVNNTKKQGKSLLDLVKPFLDEVAQQKKNQQPVINIRNLKMFLFITYQLSQYEIENLIDFLDSDKNGFIGVLDVERQMK